MKCFENFFFGSCQTCIFAHKSIILGENLRVVFSGSSFYENYCALIAFMHYVTHNRCILAAPNCGRNLCILLLPEVICFVVFSRKSIYAVALDVDTTLSTCGLRLNAIFRLKKDLVRYTSAIYGLFKTSRKEFKTLCVVDGAMKLLVMFMITSKGQPYD